MELSQYQIILVDLGPTMGGEMNKTRPCVIISPDEMNRHLKTIVIAPITSTLKKFPTRIPVKHAITKGWIVLDQIRTIDRARVVKVFESLTAREIQKVKAVFYETYVE
ncbi:MAG: hypothetical protein RLZZ630_647 [Bacteroidota bacterium]